MVSQEEEKLFVIKTALVSIGVFIASVIVVFTHIDFGFLSIVTVFVLLQLFFSELRRKAIERIFGPLLSAILILAVLMIFRNHYVIMLLATAILVVIFIYYFVVGYFPYSMILGAITISLISAMDVNKNLHQAINLGLYWVVNLLIGSVIVIMIDFFSSKWIFQKKILNIIDNLERKKTFFPFREHLSNLREKSKFNYKAGIIAIRVAATFIILLLVNRKMQWSFIDIQAVIAGIIISARASIVLSHRFALMRLLGVIVGAFIAILYAYFLQSYPSLFLTIILMTVSLGILTWLSEHYRSFEYAFLQMGVMIPLILITSNQEVINVHLAVERSLGSLEGGLVGIVMVYASHLFFLHKANSGT
ncbi:MAG: FUSC family protein [Gammaproteobacteria bacterium]|nr:FUSC family protein [Gammaproteobacteria bacterium]